VSARRIPAAAWSLRLHVEPPAEGDEPPPSRPTLPPGTPYPGEPVKEPPPGPPDEPAKPPAPVVGLA
jgi:hypothetical protein